MPRLSTLAAGTLALLGLNATWAADAPLVKTEGGLEVATMDGAFSFELGGRLMVDYAHFDDDLTDLHSGAEIRRARLDLHGVLFHDWAYQLETDFADDEADLKDAWLDYHLDSTSALRVGHFKEPFSLEEMTSSKYTTFMERALPNALVPGRRLGLGYFREAENWTLAAGVFSEEIDDDSGETGDAGTGAGLRATWAPWADGGEALHLGAAINLRNPGDDETVRFRARPEAHVADLRLVNTDKLDDVDRITRSGLEAAWVRGPFSLQGEYIRAAVDRDGDGDTDPTFSGYYAFASWFLTGESRDYDADDGEFERIRPAMPSGAWEIALRHSHIDLQDAGVEGGEQRNTTLGVNWYANPRLRFMLNYVLVDADPTEVEEGDVAEPGAAEDPSILQLRAQFDF